MCFVMKYGSPLECFRSKTSALFPCLTKLYNCCLCMGFWAGIVLSLFLYESETWGIEIILFPFITAPICWYADSIITLIHAQTNYFKSGSSISSSSSSGSTPNK